MTLFLLFTISHLAFSILWEVKESAWYRKGAGTCMKGDIELILEKLEGTLAGIL